MDGESVAPAPEPGVDTESEPRHVTAQQLAYNSLRRRILRGTLPANTRLLQTEIAAQLSLSTTPVREALRRLASEGLVRIDAHRGAVVRGLNVDELTEIYELRMVLEPLAVRKAAMRISSDELGKAEALCRQMDHLEEPTAWAEANRDFHAILTEASRSPYLIDILEGLRDKSMPYVRLSAKLRGTFAKTANVEHWQLLDACRNRDPDRAAEIEARHLEVTRDLVTQAAETQDAGKTAG